ncbi:ATP-binding cassette transporter CGR1 [Daldinia childiae]|uniref:ATP-binding cassette transporter CGR1 n=1 Tax=Daldinia childiae TaxID=326645 RepID=UPI001445C7E7|nr:ATP-binding cassette transporter CGR1 [Daldinia childiae]KAF3054949.1 ATP-binding cassette transporter CGR1 [Daldinia childiae]
MTVDQYQSTLATWLLETPKLLLRLLLARPRQPQRVEILRGLHGIVRPGELLLVLGRPGSGCSTFLKALAGDTYGFHVDDDGINYEGTTYHKMQREQSGNRIYIAELDVHFPELTLGQTIAFAVSTRPTGLDHKYPGTATSLDGPSRDICSFFNLEQAFDTKVGNTMIRGISGGEKRRASLAEAFVGGAQFQCWDNSTRGLDSSTALSFIQLLRKSADKLRLVIMMSIYQVSEAQYNHFDKVMLLYEGRQIYFGSTKEATGYFQDLGFVRLSHSTTADFLTSLTNPSERVVQQGYENRVPRTPDDFALAWRQSKQAREVLQKVQDFETATLHPKGPKTNSNPTPALETMMPVHLQMLTCLRRGFQRLRNNYDVVVASIVANSILALILSSAFYNLPHTADSMDKRAVLLFFSLIVNACTPAFEDITKVQDEKAHENPDKEVTGISIQAVPKQSAVFHWKNLSYDVKTERGTKRVLNNINGWVKPGTMTALMGVSGAGKTTLLDVLANRASSGTASGDVFIGNSPRDSSFQRRVGYVQQEDVHPPMATVRETLQLSALLRQSGTETEQEKSAYVDMILGMLDMESCADAMVGIPGQGLNIEQRKRLSIGVELVAKPELLLFLDEPTSGLDSQTAWSICTLLRKLADHGQAILCTIHQPSSQIFQMFDRLLLLSRNGQTLYFGDIGPQATTVIDYFEQNNAPKYQTTLANPAEWMLDVTSIPSDVSEWSAKYNNSTQHKEMLIHQAELLQTNYETTTEGVSEAQKGKSEYAVSYTGQLRLVTTHVFREYWRDPTYMYSKFALCAGLVRIFPHQVSLLNFFMHMN